MSRAAVTVIGAGLAGSECAFQLARLGHDVTLREQKPLKRSEAHVRDDVAELVCSNSLRSDDPHTAVGLLHEELRRVGSLILSAADFARVPAGSALAVDRDAFSRRVREGLEQSGRVRLETGEVTALPEGVVVVATGPLTSAALTQALGAYTGEKLYFYDAIAPIVAAESLDWSVAWKQSRYDKGDGADYVNLPLDEVQYRQFVDDLKTGQKVTPHAFEEPKYFEGCLPIEVMAERGEKVLAFGPMKPVGLRDPRTGKRPYAVVQLRMEDRAGTAYNLVGFQTRLTWPEQKRIFGKIPGLGHADWVRMGQIHRNTFIDGPRLLGPGLRLKAEPRLFFAGQIAGVEGYVESTACGYLTALSVHAALTGGQFVAPPGTTSLGALYRHVTGEAHPEGAPYQPTNVVHALFTPLPERTKKFDRKAAYLSRGRADLTAWAPNAPHEVSAPPAVVAAQPDASATA